jgi:CIC family chloride channel protein
MPSSDTGTQVASHNRTGEIALALPRPRRALGRLARQGAWTRQRRLVVDTIILGAVGAVAAQVFNLLLGWSSAIFLGGLAGYHPPGLPSEGGRPLEIVGAHGLWLVPVAITLGGLIVGVLTTWLAPEAEGHGTDAVARAFHQAGGSLRARVAPVKLLASAITIGSGGSAGREGPIALVAAGIGSWYADFTKRDDRDRRVLLLVGAAAGLSAVFRSPIGAALFVIEVVYAEMEFESGVLLYATLAAIIAYALNGMIVGWGALFVVPPIAELRRPLDYGWFAILGIVAGVLATALPVVFYRVRDAFHALPVHPAFKPAIGGLLTGLIALVLPQIIGGGYGWVQRAIDGDLAFSVLLVLALVKIVAMSLTVASGGSGGVFAPSLFAGAMLGGACASLAHLPPGPFVVVGMAAVFAGAAHVPIATMMMVTEMTGGYTLLVPAALAVMLSYLVQMRLSSRLRYRSVYEAQVANRSESPAHHSQHLETALRILRERELTNVGDVGEVDLVRLLRVGIPVEMAGGQRLVVGVVPESSAIAGRTIAHTGRRLGGVETNIIAILREDHLIVPHVDTVFRPGDGLVLVAADDAVDQLGTVLELWS